MDDLARYNRERWEELAAADLQYTRPMLDLTPDSARELADPHGLLGEVAGGRVLCLAGGGGQQSAAFGLLGAEVTVLDLSPTQLERDRLAAAHYGLSPRLLLGDMRDLSVSEPGEFDLVWHAHSLNFIPDAVQVFREIARVLRPGGMYRVSFTNPFTHTVWETAWDGRGYSLRDPYVDGEVIDDDPFWEFEDAEGQPRRVRGPREFRHRLSTVVNGLCGLGFCLRGLWESEEGDMTAPPGTAAHCQAIAPWWLTIVAQMQGGRDG